MQRESENLSRRDAACRVSDWQQSIEQDGQANQEKTFIQLRRVPANAVAEIHSPRQSRRRAVRLVTQPSQKATDSPDRDPNCQRNCEQVTGRAADAYIF